MLITIKNLLDKGYLDEYMPDRLTRITKYRQILDWIKSGELKTQNKLQKKKYITEEAIQDFKNNINNIIEEAIRWKKT